MDIPIDTLLANPITQSPFPVILTSQQPVSSPFNPLSIRNPPAGTSVSTPPLPLYPTLHSNSSGHTLLKITHHPERGLVWDDNCPVNI